MRKVRSLFSGGTPGKRSVGSLGILALTTVVVSTSVILGQGGGGGDAGAANSWVASSGSVPCTRSATPVSYATAQANGWLCGTFDAANDVCQGGDIVYAKTTSAYPGETITGSNSRTSACRIEPEPNTGRIQFSSDFTFGSIGGNGPDWLTVKKVQCGSDTTSFTNGVNLNIFDQSDNIVIDDWDCPYLDLFDASNVTIRNSDFGPCGSAAGRGCGFRIAQANQTIQASNVTVEDTTIHDMWCGTGSDPDCAAFHLNGMSVFGTRNLTLRRVKFFRNDTTNIRFQNNTSNGTPNTNVTIENSWFNSPCLRTEGTNCSGGFRSNAIDIDDQAANFTLQFNSFANQTYPDCNKGSCGTSAAPAVFRGNIYSIQDNFCAVTNVQYFYNATNDWGGYTGGPCAGSTGDVNGDFPTYANSSNTSSMDYHLSGPNGPADNLVASGCIATDIDGAARAATNCDAGSDER